MLFCVAGGKIPSFRMPAMPAAFGRFMRSSKKGETPSASPPESRPPPPSSAMAREELEEEPRGAIGGREPYGAKSSAPSGRGRVTSYESYAPPVDVSFRSGHDSQV
jgi:hypothetical protein